MTDATVAAGLAGGRVQGGQGDGAARNGGGRLPYAIRHTPYAIRHTQWVSQAGVAYAAGDDTIRHTPYAIGFKVDGVF